MSLVCKNRIFNRQSNIITVSFLSPNHILSNKLLLKKIFAMKAVSSNYLARHIFNSKSVIFTKIFIEKVYASGSPNTKTSINNNNKKIPVQTSFSKQNNHVHYFSLSERFCSRRPANKFGKGSAAIPPTSLLPFVLFFK